ncbi:MAG: DUF1553 domain-containing protein, partial [Planctomycetales bacterium]|nr:DUF1553 domain-containing protein [Planctomycetales bacterium]
MTIACARCHDHKFDAISSADYYALCGFLQSSSYQEADVADPGKIAEISSQLRRLSRDTARTMLRELGDKLVVQAVELLKVQDDATTAAWLNAAKQDVSDPLFMLQLLRDRAPLDTQAPKVLTPPSNDGVGYVVDFSKLPRHVAHDDWLTTGFAFGSAPLEIGDLIWNPIDAEQAAQLNVVPLAVQERRCVSNREGGAHVSGRYRTRTFEIAGSRLWYLCRGGAKAFVVVDSHRTVAGPLHGSCRQDLPRHEQWQWQVHRVDDYVGHRVHVEFTPQGDFELAAVVCSDQPPESFPKINESVATRFNREPLVEYVSAVESFGRALLHACEMVLNEQATPSDAQLVEWLLRHSDVWLARADDNVRQTVRAHTQAYLARRQELESQLPAKVAVLALQDGSGENERIHLRGNPRRLAPEPTPRRFLTALDGDFPIPVGSGRLELARRVADADNPLTARVFVNRVWAHLLGEGIVPTVDNFGVLGEAPSHPELLDYL